MMTPVTTEEIITALGDRLQGEPGGVVVAYLFGSVARGEQRPDSDIDLGVLYAQEPTHTLGSEPALLESRLERALRRRVQVVCLNTAPPDLVHRVMRDGILVLEQDPSRRVAFEVAARNEGFDLLPFLQRCRQPRNP